MTGAEPRLSRRLRSRSPEAARCRKQNPFYAQGGLRPPSPRLPTAFPARPGSHKKLFCSRLGGGRSWAFAALTCAPLAPAAPGHELWPVFLLAAYDRGGWRVGRAAGRTAALQGGRLRGITDGLAATPLTRGPGRLKEKCGFDGKRRKEAGTRIRSASDGVSRGLWRRKSENRKKKRNPEKS